MKTFRPLIATILGFGVAAAVSTTATAAGTLRYATVGEPPSLDQQVITSDLATTIAQHIFEGLYTFNSKYAPVPLLAEGEKISDDGKTVVIAIRKGVKFHDGSDLTSEDVIASLKRWGAHGSRGKLLFEKVASVEATGDYEVTLKFTDTFGPWKNLMALHQRRSGHLSGRGRWQGRRQADRRGSVYRYRSLQVQHMETEPLSRTGALRGLHVALRTGRRLRRRARSQVRPHPLRAGARRRHAN